MNCKNCENIDKIIKLIIFKYYDFDEEEPVFRFCIGNCETSGNYKTYEDAFIAAKKFLMKEL